MKEKVVSALLLTSKCYQSSRGDNSAMINWGNDFLSVNPSSHSLSSIL